MSAAFNDEEIDAIMDLARELTGTKVTRAQHSVIVHNVAVRISTLNLTGLEAYLSYVEQNESEVPFLLSALTIHTTSWFREPLALEKFQSDVKSRWQSAKPGETIRILSIACSTGEEVYSLAAIMESFRLLNPSVDYAVEGWDIDPISLRRGRDGVYDYKTLAAAAERFRNLVPTEKISEELFKVGKELMKRVRFRAVNIVTPPADEDKFHYVLCRNMLIYFEAADVEKIVKFVTRKLVSGGMFITGVSETGGVTIADFSSIGSACYTYKKGLTEIKDSVATSVSSQLMRPAPSGRPIGKAILVVEDEASLRSAMVEYLRDEGYDVSGAANSAEASSLLLTDKFGLVFSDNYMPPGKTGVELAQQVREAGYRGAFVLVSGGADLKLSQRALAVGCTDVLLKPCRMDEILRVAQLQLKTNIVPKSFVYGKPELVLFGASTGGTQVLSRSLAKMPSNMPPLLVVQHIAPNFAKDFAVRLAQETGLVMGKMENDAPLLNGHIYCAFGHYHIGVKRVGGQLRLVIDNSGPINSHMPSVDFLFKSAVNVNAKIFAALLTGMGRDGALGMQNLYHAGAETCVQNEETCVVFGMPKEAIRLGGVTFIGSPDEIRQLLNKRLVGVTSDQKKPNAA